MSTAVTVIISAVVSVFVSFITFEYRFRRERSHEEKQEVREWYSESAELARKVQRTWQRKYVRPKNSKRSSASYDEVQKKMNLYATQLSGHASESTNLDVDEEIVGLLEETANCCEDLYNIRLSLNGYTEFDENGDRLEDLTEKLQKEAVERLT